MQAPIEFRFWDTYLTGWICPAVVELTATGNFYSIRVGNKNLKQDRFIVSQYSGYKDVKGNKIYAGDIMNSILDEPNDRRYWPVIFELGGFWIDGSIISDHESSSDNYALDDLEIAGNIYQNLDLLPDWQRQEFS